MMIQYSTKKKSEEERTCFENVVVARRGFEWYGM